MSLTLGSIAPLTRPPGGSLNVALPAEPQHLLFLHGLDRRIRGEVAGVTVVDSCQAAMLHETGLLPRWYFPRSAITGALQPSQTRTHCPFKGDARYWDLRVGDRLVRDAFWEYAEPLAGAPTGLAGLLAPYQEKFDRWREEDETVIGHPRDPFHRVDARLSSRRVTVWAGDQPLAETSRPVGVFETGLPPRWYLPRRDVRMELLTSSPTSTVCPYKGVASYWSLGDQADVAWCYEQPLAEALPAAGYLSFEADGISVQVEPG